MQRTDQAMSVFRTLGVAVACVASAYATGCASDSAKEGDFDAGGYGENGDSIGGGLTGTGA